MIYILKLCYNYCFIKLQNVKLPSAVNSIKIVYSTCKVKSVRLTTWQYFIVIKHMWRSMVYQTFLFYFPYITFIHRRSQINFKLFPTFLSVCLSYLLQQFSIHMIHRKLHSLRCEITFICYGSCKPRPSEIPVPKYQ